MAISHFVMIFTMYFISLPKSLITHFHLNKSSKYSPSAGAVKGTFLRFFDSRSFGTSEISCRPFPTSIKNATKTRTMLYKNPDPVTI